MTKQFLKKKSKRVSTRKRTKIERKVREHNRKLKKTAKKNENRPGKKKDIGVPNSLPFKGEILKEAELNKQRREAERQKKKLQLKAARAEKVAQKRNLNSLVTDAAKRNAQFESKVQTQKTMESGRPAERSMKAFYQKFQQVVKEADVVLQVLDARDPLGTRCPQVEQAVLEAGSSKRLVLVLNKIDLIPPENVELWLKYLRNEFPTVAIKCSTQKQNKQLSFTSRKILDSKPKAAKASGGVGIDNLLKLLGSYRHKQNFKQAITVGAVGFPNTGKSSLVNTLKRGKACNVGSTPGLTRTVQAVQIDQNVKLLDCPGIVMASGKSDASLILRNSIKVENLSDPLPAVEAILRRCNKAELMVHYKLPDFQTPQDFLLVLATRMGKLKKGGLPDGHKAARILLQDWNRGKIAYYSQPPESHSMPTHLSAEVVQEMSQEFDIDALIAEEKSYLNNLNSSETTPMLIDSVGFTKGLTGEEEDTADDNDDEEFEDIEDDDEPPQLVTVMDLAGDSNDDEAKEDDLENVQVTLKPRNHKKAMKNLKKKKRRSARATQ